MKHTIMKKYSVFLKYGLHAAQKKSSHCETCRESYITICNKLSKWLHIEFRVHTNVCNNAVVQYHGGF